MPRNTSLRSQSPTALPPLKRLARRAVALLPFGRPNAHPPEHEHSPVLDPDTERDLDAPDTALGDGVPPAGPVGETPVGSPPGGDPHLGPSEEDTYNTPG